MKKTIKVRQLDAGIKPIKDVDKGDWIDLRVSSVELERASQKYKVIKRHYQPEDGCLYLAGDLVKIGLGVAMELPEGYEANIVPRSSTFKNYGLIQVNHFGVVDSSYCGDNDEWFFVGYALRDGHLFKGDRVCQFRINKTMPEVDIEFVETLNNEDRGGLGSTGRR